MLILQLSEISEDLEERMKTIEFIGFESSGVYEYKSEKVGTYKLRILKIKAYSKVF